ncbi:substrate-binding domain-containing protein [[Clostridium] fimetarium]|uniref:ABC-type sugar transport system, substrate-binding protein, contains N-terminal xre family HTH domain n=1 Tax=[Clostridium] fimetarium TaxID=99656 RepID=A0A1I0PKC3_9FIRM|nr:substrate-binding domain-containing protein [[Clostridium] fimetarium]SEW14896.1 ABC-type sugar transport system, substrate-binding protein, contains N-terminal xre family HTH domain [[Clostridium] fimetarium]
MDEREFVIILSDIHIGTTAPTVWYRKEVHERYLIAILDSIIDCANKIQEVILLGDIFEFWSYPPNVIPPTLDDIITANPNILGAKGKLRQLLSALKGRIIYICGDHDINITKADLNKLKSPDGYTIKYQSAAYIPTYDTGILFTHGHEFTLLNAPYLMSELAPLPLGYFVTRAIAYKIQKELSKKPGLPNVNLEEYGDCILTELLSKIPCLLKKYANGPDFVNEFIDAVAYSTGIPKDLQIHVDETTTVTLNNVKEIYKNLLNEFLSTDFNRTYQPWYVQKDALENFIDIVFMGSTHSPIVDFSEDMIDYVNTGSRCPLILNLREKQITYEIYNRSKQFVSLMKVTDVGEKKLTFGWSVYNASWEYFRAMQDGVLAKAKELGIDVIKHDQKSNSAEMITGCFDLISKDVNALLISPYNPEGVPTIVAAANRKSIPVVVIDGGTGGADVAAFIVSDSFGGGILAGEYALILLKEHSIKSKNVAIIKAEKTATYALLRGQGFKSVMTEKGYDVIAEVSANGEQALAYEAMKNILVSYENDLAVVFCENGLMTLGAAQAIDEVGKKGKIMLIGFDADPSVLTGIKDGSIQGTIAQQPFKMGEIGVEIANSILLGIPVTYDDWTKKEILMEVYLIDEKGEARIGII